jgi:hypothetical protein
MLDVHPPHHSANTWRDFFIHIATIVVGLLIAVALEQTVEAIHHRHQRNELQEAIRTDTEKTIQDAENGTKYTVANVRLLETRIGQVEQALDTNRPLPTSPAPNLLDFDIADDPAWKAAKSSGLTELLPQSDIKAYSEVDGLTAFAQASFNAKASATNQRRQFEGKFERNGAKDPDFSHVTRQELDEYLTLLLAEKSDLVTFGSWCGYIHGAETAILKGERDLNRIQHAER